jgi:hypothetical protein
MHTMNANLKSWLLPIACVLLVSGALSAAGAQKDRAVPGFFSPAITKVHSDCGVSQSNGLCNQEISENPLGLVLGTDVGARNPMLSGSGCVCFGFSGLRTSTYTFAGVDCTAVGNGIFDLASSEANSDCAQGVCFTSAVHYTTACQQEHDGSWKGSGYINFKCWLCNN